jgi:hypothetical protein
MKDEVAKDIYPLAWPTLSELLAKTVEYGIPIHI